MEETEFESSLRNINGRDTDSATDDCIKVNPNTGKLEESLLCDANYDEDVQSILSEQEISNDNDVATPAA